LHLHVAKRFGMHPTQTLSRFRFTNPIELETLMADAKSIKEHMEIIGADGVHIGTVDKVEGDRIKLTKKDSGEGAHQGHHHYLSLSLVADVEGNQVRMAGNADVEVTFEEEADHKQA
jgi:hypothetical protein